MIALLAFYFKAFFFILGGGIVGFIVGGILSVAIGSWFIGFILTAFCTMLGAGLMLWLEIWLGIKLYRWLKKP